MKFSKLALAFIISSLALPSHLLSQATQDRTILEFVQAHQKPKNLFSLRGRLLNASNAGITSLQDIEQIKGMEKVWGITVNGNRLGAVKKNAFNYPQLSNLSSLDLSYCGIEVIEPGAFNGLENLRFLWLNGNKLMSIADGALSGLNKNKILFVFIADNQGTQELRKQIQKQLPQATVYTINITPSRLKKAATVAKIATLTTILALGILAVHTANARHAAYLEQLERERPEKIAAARRVTDEHKKRVEEEQARRSLLTPEESAAEEAAEQQEECAICRDEYTADNPAVQIACPSGHVSHAHCLEQWLERKKLCPICRQPIKTTAK